MRSGSLLLVVAMLVAGCPFGPIDRDVDVHATSRLDESMEVQYSARFVADEGWERVLEEAVAQVAPGAQVHVASYPRPGDCRWDGALEHRVALGNGTVAGLDQRWESTACAEQGIGITLQEDGVRFSSVYRD